MQYWLLYLYQGDASGHVFPVPNSTVYLTSYTKSYKNSLLYPVGSCKLRDFVIKITQKEFMKLFEDILFFTVGWSLWRSFPENRVACSVPKSNFPPMEIKINFRVMKLSAGCSTADCRHRPLTEWHDIAGNTAYWNFWVEVTCVMKYRCELVYCTFVVWLI